MGSRKRADVRLICPTCPKEIIGLSLAGTAQHAAEPDHPAWETANYTGSCPGCGADFDMTVTRIEGERF